MFNKRKRRFIRLIAPIRNRKVWEIEIDNQEMYFQK